jgi:hemerythrin-like metal-binding protein
MNILLHWSDDYSLNIKRIDEQHKKLVEMINRVYDSIIRNEDDDVLDQVISDMADYAFVHFKNEEKYFEQFSYEEASSHIAEHKFFLKKVEKFRDEHKSHHPELKQEVMSFLQKWLTNHIMHTDRKYKDCFLKGGIK